jgi:hypothetical protein
LVVDSPQDEGCPPISNSLESLFDKEGLRELGAKGVEEQSRRCFRVAS